MNIVHRNQSPLRQLRARAADIFHAIKCASTPPTLDPDRDGAPKKRLISDIERPRLEVYRIDEDGKKVPYYSGHNLGRCAREISSLIGFTQALYLIAGRFDVVYLDVYHGLGLRRIVISVKGKEFTWTGAPVSWLGWPLLPEGFGYKYIDSNEWEDKSSLFPGEDQPKERPWSQVH